MLDNEDFLSTKNEFKRIHKEDYDEFEFKVNKSEYIA